MRTREDIAASNQNHRKRAYAIGAAWGALGAMGPFGMFFCDVIMKVPQPISTTYKSGASDDVPLGDRYEVWDAQYASTADEVSAIVWLLVGALAGVAFAVLLYFFAVYVADPVMCRIDLRNDGNREKGVWLKRGIVGAIIAVYCLVCIGLMMGSQSVSEKYVWLADDKGTYYRIDRNTYEYYRSKNNNQVKERETETTTESTEPTKEPTTEKKKTPVERGYPSNDLQYYIDHPDEPMPEEVLGELYKMDYDPGMSYDYGEGY